MPVPRIYSTLFVISFSTTHSRSCGCRKLKKSRTTNKIICCYTFLIVLISFYSFSSLTTTVNDDFHIRNMLRIRTYSYTHSTYMNFANGLITFQVYGWKPKRDSCKSKFLASSSLQSSTNQQKKKKNSVEVFGLGDSYTTHFLVCILLNTLIWWLREMLLLLVNRKKNSSIRKNVEINTFFLPFFLLSLNSELIDEWDFRLALLVLCDASSCIQESFWWSENVCGKCFND